MSNMIKCKQGHCYDQFQNSRCPFCGVGDMDIVPMTAHDEPDDRSTMSEYISDQEPVDNDNGNTVAYDAVRRPSGSASSDPEITRAIWTQKLGIDPVVGWLVCAEGSNRGRDYRIRSGWNSIGRDPAMQICIAGDDTISREDHAKLFFDLKSQSFHITSGAGRSGLYVNGAAVLQPTKLEPYDKIEIGDSILVFVPFCSERFSWEPA